MKKYIIAIILFIISLIIVDDVYAAGLPQWAVNANILRPVQAHVYDCTSSACTVDLKAYYGVDLDYDGQNFYEQTKATSMSVNGPGIMWTYQVHTNLNPTTLYSLTTYICHNFMDGEVNLVYKGMYGSTTLANVRNKVNPFNTKTTNYYTNLYPAPFPDQIDGLGGCGYINAIFTPTAQTKWLGVNFSVDTAVSNYKSILIGYQVEALGNANVLSSSDIQEVIDDSNLATASSITEVQKAQQQIKTEIQAMQEEQQVTNEKLDETNQQLGDLNNNITNSDSSEATNSASGFFEDFNTDTFGLTSIITAPLNLINNLTSSSCSPLTLEIPFVNKTMQLPCMSTIYSRYFGAFLSIYQIITFGFTSYWVCVRVFALVKDFKNPDHDEIEVMDL